MRKIYSIQRPQLTQAVLFQDKANVMRNLLKSICVFAIMFMALSAAALADIYPPTLDSGNLVLVSGKMGYGYYADRNSVKAVSYKPPYYELKIRVLDIKFSEDYWKKHETYAGGPYTVVSSVWDVYRYNWNSKIISYKENGVWQDWDCNRQYYGYEEMERKLHAAEVAFVSAYKKRFFNDKMQFNPLTNQEYRVITEDYYRYLNI